MEASSQKMTTTEVIEAVAREGCRIVLVDGEAVVRGNPTSYLLSALKAAKKQILETLFPIPGIVWFLMSEEIILSSLPLSEPYLPRDKPVIRKRVPSGARGWRLGGETEWRPMSELPAHWGLIRSGPVDVEHEEES